MEVRGLQLEETYLKFSQVEENMTAILVNLCLMEQADL